MKFEIMNILMDPFVLMFLAVTTGLLLGKVKFGKFCLGASGTLFTGLLIGWFIFRVGTDIIARGQGANGFLAATKMIKEGIVHTYLFNASMIFFVAAVGLLAAKDMGVVLKKYGFKFVLLGLIITLMGAASTFGATLLIPGANPYEIAGVYTGALTSSPGLSAALETGKEHATNYVEDYSTYKDTEKEKILLRIDPSGDLIPETTPDLTQDQERKYITNAEANVGVGHAIGYPFGVIVVIFVVNFFPGIFGIDIIEEKRRYAEDMKQTTKSITTKELPTTPFSLTAFSLACIIGYLVGNIEIYLGPLGYFSLGITGGVLIMALVLGYIGKIGLLSFRMEPKILTLIREIGMAFLLAVVGLKYGFMFFDSLMGSGVALALTSLVVSIVAVFSGFFVGRYVFKLNWVMLAGSICGGMTSTPGLGAAIDALDSDDPAAGYGATYPFALLGMIIFTIILHKLPIY